MESTSVSVTAVVMEKNHIISVICPYIITIFITDASGGRANTQRSRITQTGTGKGQTEAGG